MIPANGVVVNPPKARKKAAAPANDSVALIDFAASVYTWETAWNACVGEVLDVRVRVKGLPYPAGDLYDFQTWLGQNGLKIRRGYKVGGKLPPHRGYMARFRLEIVPEEKVQ